jgi:hypothetical protein
VGPRLKTLVHRSWTGILGRSSWFPGAEVAGVQDGSWSRHCFAWLYLAAKPSHMGADVDGLACLLHCPAVRNHQTRGQSILIGAAPSHHTVVGGGTIPRGAEPLGLDI